MKNLHEYIEESFICESVFDDKMDDVLDLLKYLSPDTYRKYIKSFKPLVLTDFSIDGPIVNANCNTIKEFKYDPRIDVHVLWYIANEPKITVRCKSTINTLKVCTDEQFNGHSFTGDLSQYNLMPVENLNETVSKTIVFKGVTGFKNCVIHYKNKGDGEFELFCSTLNSWDDFEGLTIDGFKPRKPDAEKYNTAFNDKFCIYLCPSAQGVLCERVRSELINLKRKLNKYGEDSKEYREAEQKFVEPIVKRFPNVTCVCARNSVADIKLTKDGTYVVRFQKLK